MTIKKLVIAGAGGLGREIAWLVEEINKTKMEWDLMGFVDDGPMANTIEGYPVLGPISSLNHIAPQLHTTVAIGDPRTRLSVVNRIRDMGVVFATLIHPDASMSAHNRIGIGSVVCSGSIITTNVAIGEYCIINLGCYIGHDSILEDYVSLMPATNLAGNVLINRGTFMGLSSTVINGMIIGSWSIIGAGAAVVGDIPDYSVAVGVPARVIKSLQ